MKITIPEQLKSEVPQTSFGRILTATPIIMTVLATMLAGLASSEMTRAQYDRALAAQQQSKAGDQWSFFQAKRVRGAIQRNTVDLLQSMVGFRALDPAALRAVVEKLPQNEEAASIRNEVIAVLESSEGRSALGFLQRGELPQVSGSFSPGPEIKAAMEAVEASRPDSDVTPLLAKITNDDLEQALAEGRERVEAFDDTTGPINQAIDRLDALMGSLSGLSEPKADPAPGLIPGSNLQRDFTAARLRYAAMRYETEARLNQGIANLYELQVRKSNASAQRHHARSQRFFFGMLAAQMAVIIATFAIAARQRNLLWSIAALAGLAAIGLAIYVYVYV
jgi:hypothetical protein